MRSFSKITLKTCQLQNGLIKACAEHSLCQQWTAIVPIPYRYGNYRE